jgi:hypothetical protein
VVGSRGASAGGVEVAEEVAVAEADSEVVGAGVEEVEGIESAVGASLGRGKRRIFASMGRSVEATRERRIYKGRGHESDEGGKKQGKRRTEHNRSGSFSNAAPIPPCRLNDFGQPQFRPTPATSCSMTLSACAASSGDAEPSWKMRRGFSTGWQSKIERPPFTKETTPVLARDVKASVMLSQTLRREQTAYHRLFAQNR